MTGFVFALATSRLWWLGLALLLVALGPAVYAVARRRQVVLSTLDGFVLAAVGVLVVVHILPEGIATGGWPAVLAAVLGLAAPLLMEHFAGHAHERAHGMVQWLAVAGLLLHAAVDGVALAGGADRVGSGKLAQAVLLHRLPVGIALWWMFRPTRGVAVATGVLAAVGLATLAGFFLSEPLTTPLEGSQVAVFQAFVAGSLLHVLVHRYSDGQGGAGWRLAETGGALAGLALVLGPALLGAGHGHAHGHGAGAEMALGPYGGRFMALALETAPALFLGYLLAGVIKELLPESSLKWMRKGPPPVQAARGMLFGIPLPICSCGIVPLYQGLVQRGVPATAAMAFLVATPEIGVESVLLSFSLLGVELTAVRLVAAALVALLAGWVVGRTVKVTASPFAMAMAGKAPAAPGWGRRLWTALRYGFVDVVEDTAPWILVGVAIAAALDPAYLAPWVSRLPAGLDVLLFALLGIPVYVCASAATPLAAAFILIGVSPGAALAFLLSGPATNVTTFGVLSGLHGRRTSLLFGGFILVLTVGLGLLINLTVGAVTVPIAKLPGPEQAAWWAWAALALVLLAFGRAVLRMGPRAFVGTILAFGRTAHRDDG
jgi:hypothetical protein